MRFTEGDTLDCTPRNLIPRHEMMLGSPRKSIGRRHARPARGGEAQPSHVGGTGNGPRPVARSAVAGSFRPRIDFRLALPGPVCPARCSLGPRLPGPIPSRPRRPLAIPCGEARSCDEPLRESGPTRRMLTSFVGVSPIRGGSGVPVSFKTRCPETKSSVLRFFLNRSPETGSSLAYKLLNARLAGASERLWFTKWIRRTSIRLCTKEYSLGYLSFFLEINAEERPLLLVDV